MGMQTRKRNFHFAWLGTFMAGVAFSEAIPFLSLYIAQLGDFTTAQVGFYTGLAYAASYIVVIIVSPIWGKIADNYGRKPMLMRTAFGMAIVVTLIGCSTAVWQIVVLRLCQGFFDGYTPSAIALVSAETPAEEKTKVIATLSTGYILGGLLGPIFGGVLGAVLSYRAIFLLTGFILMWVGLLSVFGIKEEFVKPVKQDQRRAKAFFKFLTLNIVLLLGMTMMLQLVESLITPFISLAVSELLQKQSYLSMMAGLISALPGLATALSATPMGSLSVRYGEIRILMITDTILMIIYILLGMTSSLIVFGVLRFMGGICSGALFPMVQVLLSKSTDQVSTIFSWGLSAQSMGSMFGSVFGSVILQFAPLQGLFWIAAIVLLLNVGMLWQFKRVNWEVG